ncbi:MAG: DUF1501 domain-containing protein [Cyclobacteriaceae bacterium]
MNEEIRKEFAKQTRRDFFKNTAMGFGSLAMANMMNPIKALGKTSEINPLNGVLGAPHFAPKAKRVIYLHMAGAPSQIELFDYKPELNKRFGQEIPDSVRGKERNSGMVANQSSFPLVGSPWDFKKYGKSGIEISDLLPHMGKVADELCVIKSMHTDHVNHEPAIMFMQTGSQISGRPSIGSWVNYGLGTDNENLPSFVVMISKGAGGQGLNSNAWGAGFLPSHHQGVQFRSGKEPVLYLNNPHGIDQKSRREALNHIKELNNSYLDFWGDPEIQSKIAAYEMAYKMQTSVPEVTDTSKEPDYIYDMYGDDAKKPGTFASNCLLARKLAEKDVKFIQLYHVGWDHHGGLPKLIPNMAKSIDQPISALIKDLKQRGLLEDTLVVWGGEFGRTAFSQGRLERNDYGRDHHPGCFSMFMAGAGVKKGMTYGQTDDFSYSVTENPVHVHDFQATLMHLIGIDHERLTYRYQGRKFRLTDVHGHVVKDILT